MAKIPEDFSITTSGQMSREEALRWSPMSPELLQDDSAGCSRPQQPEPTPAATGEQLVTSNSWQPSGSAHQPDQARRDR